MQFKWLWLEDFVTLTETGNFARAAEKRCVDPAAFGRRIKALEEWADVRLVYQPHQPLELTPEGHAFLETAKEQIAVLTKARDALRRARKLREDPHTVYFATGKTLARIAFPDWFLELRQRVGPFKANVRTTPMHDGTLMLVHGQVDFLFCYCPPDVRIQLDTEEFDYRHFRFETLIAVAAPDEQGQPLHRLPSSRLDSVPYLSFADTLSLGRIVRAWLALTPFHKQLLPVFESDFAESLRELALKGLGLAWLPGSLIENDLEAGRLVRADRQDNDIRFEVRIYRARNNQKPLVDRIWSCLGA
jgi:DNA-binding transcriptional LysR family regulator